MNSGAILGIFVLFLAFNIILGQEFQFGQIYENSIRIDLPTHFSQNLAVGNNASLNATMRVSRTIHGIKLRSLENPGASADIIAGGIGYNFVTFMLRRNSNTLYFIAEAYENNTLGIETTTAVPTTPLPERVLQLWGVVNSGSVALNPKTYYSAASVPGHIAQRDVSISLSKVIHGIRVISYNDTAAEAVITDGGIGSNFTSIRVIGKASYLSFSVELFENGNAPTTPVQTTTNPTTIPTTPIPEKRVEEWGKFDDIARLDEKTFENYPPIWTTANDNVAIPVNGIIYGIRLTSLNYTTGLYEIIAGGLEDNYVTFNFRGSRPGEPYNFNIEIYGNNAVNVKISIALFTMLVFVYNLLS